MCGIHNKLNTFVVDNKVYETNIYDLYIYTYFFFLNVAYKVYHVSESRPLSTGGHAYTALVTVVLTAAAYLSGFGLCGCCMCFTSRSSPCMTKFGLHDRTSTRRRSGRMRYRCTVTTR